jgi:isocitrate/isopropylmalate dehydrogenase
VNPIGIILAARMMLDYLNESEMAYALESAIAKVIRDGKLRTYDMAGCHHNRHGEGDCGGFERNPSADR